LMGLVVGLVASTIIMMVAFLFDVFLDWLFPESVKFMWC
jgi:hypothetical protein